MQESCDGNKANLHKGLHMPDIALKSWDQNLLSCLVSSCSTLGEGMIQHNFKYLHLKYVVHTWKKHVKGFMGKCKVTN